LPDKPQRTALDAAQEPAPAQAGDRHRLSAEARADLDALISQAATKRTARAWLYREQLRAILDRKKINVVVAMLTQWCTNVGRSKSLPSRRRGSSR
jgi:hypothetical protein